MSVKEKLVELLQNDNCPLFMVFGDKVDVLADFLITNGVTVQRWIPVTERVPKKNGQYVCRYVFGGDTHFPFYQVLWYFASEENPHFQHAGALGLRVTHWMPLPEPPKEDE